MASLKILHTADWHIGAAFGALSGEQARLRKAHLWQTVDRMIALAKEEQVDAFLIAGDVFESINVSLADVRTAFQKLATLMPIPVYIAAGNHDPLNQESFYAFLELPENVHVMSGDRIERIEIKPGAYLFGRSFSHRFETGLVGNFSASLGENEVGVMLIHGDAGGGEEYNPIKKEVMASSGMNYWALGHIHKRSAAESAGNSFYAYPGAPEGHGFDELGEMGVYVAEIMPHTVDLRFVPISEHRYEEINIDVTDCETEEMIRTKALSLMGAGRERHLYKIVLTGESKGGFSAKSLAESLSGDAFYVKVKNKTEREERAEESWSPLAVKMKEYIDAADADEEVRKFALYLGRAALSGKKVDILED